MPPKPRPRRPKPGEKVGFRASPCRSPGGKVGFATPPCESPAKRSALPLRRAKLRVERSALPLRRAEVRVERSAFALRQGEVRAGRSAFALRQGEVGTPGGDPISVYPGKETAAHSRVNFREIQAPGYQPQKSKSAAVIGGFFVPEHEEEVSYEYADESAADQRG